MDAPLLPQGMGGDDFEPLSREELQYDKYLLSVLLPLSDELWTAHKIRQEFIFSMFREEIPWYVTTEPILYYQASLLNHKYTVDVERKFQMARGKLLRAIDEALHDLRLFSAGFDYKTTFDGYLEKLFEQNEDMPAWHHLREQMVRLFPQQVMIAADYFAGMQRTTNGAWTLGPLHPHSQRELRMQEQEESAREVKEAFEKLCLEMAELDLRHKRNSYGRAEHNHFMSLLEEFDVARWNFTQIALDYIKGQIYECLLAEHKRIE